MIDQEQILQREVTAAPRYLPIADYGVIGDSRSIALVSRDGSIDWWCLPRFDSDAVFARLLDADLGGYCALRPLEPFEVRRDYFDDTNILVTEFTTARGVIRLVDFMPALTEAQKREHPIPARALIRRVECVTGEVAVGLDLRARPHFGLSLPKVRRQNHEHYVLDWGADALHVVSSVPLIVEDATLTATVHLTAGDRFDLGLSYSMEAPADLLTLGSFDLLERLTREFWTGWATVCGYSGPYRDAVMRSALVLKLLTYAPSGAIIAAPTTSLPEEIGGERNWDYRYCWLRDAAFTIRALLSLGYQAEAHAFAGWLIHATHLTHPELQIVYTVHGESRIPERTLDFLEGYQASQPVRVGNAAAKQFQLDVYGEVLDALALYHRNGGVFDGESRRLVRGMVEVIGRRWHEPDEGIWEVRSGRSHHIHSKVMAAVGLERALELSQTVHLGSAGTCLTSTRDAIRSWILAHGYSGSQGAFTRTPGSDLDAALLVIPLVDFLPPQDPRVVGTVEAVQRALARDELVYRYRAPDGLSGDEGGFVICSFWLVEALARIGRIDEAYDHFERLLARSNDLGLLAEEIDPRSGEQLGNFPQAFSHIGLINAALTLAEVG